jgi:hypothetical protein
MILNTTQILKQSNYYIEYNFRTEDQQGIINVAWKDTAIFALRYNPALKSLVTNWKDLVIPCPNYAATAIGYLIIKDICKVYGYPMYWIQYKLDGNAKDGYVFDVTNTAEELNAAQYVYNLLVTEVLQEGLNPEHIEMAKAFGVWDGFKSVLDFYLGVRIDSPTE